MSAHSHIGMVGDRYTGIADGTSVARVQAYRYKKKMTRLSDSFRTERKKNAGIEVVGDADIEVVGDADIEVIGDADMAARRSKVIEVDAMAKALDAVADPNGVCRHVSGHVFGQVCGNVYGDAVCVRASSFVPFKGCR